MFEKVIGYESHKKELSYLIDMMNNEEKYTKIGVHLPRGVVLYGPPGTGKTLTAQEFIAASSWNHLDFHSDNLNHENGSEHVNAVYKEAQKKQPCIILFDDYDKVVDTIGGRFGAAGFNALQLCMDRYAADKIFTLVTTNIIDIFPDSLLRAGRLENSLKFTTPSIRDGEAIVRYYLSQKPLVAEVNYDLVARLMSGHSCAEMEEVLNLAAIYAGFQGKDKIEEQDIISAILRIVFKAPEISSTDETQEEKYRKALHEAGHAVMITLLEPESLTLVSVKHHTGDIGGITMQRSWDDTVKEKMYLYLENQIMISYGGKAALEVVCQDIDYGCGKDLRDIDSVMLCLLKSVQAFGPGFDEFDAVHERALMERYYTATKQMLFQNRDFLLALAGKLMEKETLTYEEVFALQHQIEATKELELY